MIAYNILLIGLVSVSPVAVDDPVTVCVWVDEVVVVFSGMLTLIVCVCAPAVDVLWVPTAFH